MRLPVYSGLLGLILPVGMLLAPGAEAERAATLDEGTFRSGWSAPDTIEYYVRVLWWGEAGSGPGQFGSLRGLGSDADGYIYVCDSGNHRVQKFDSLGNFLMMFGEEGTGPGQFVSTWDVAVGEDGFIYVCDYSANRVQKFDSLGNYLLDWGDPGLEPGQLTRPHGIAVGDSGYVYIADWGFRIQRFFADGEFDLYWTHPDTTVHGGRVVATYPGSVYTRWVTGDDYFFRHDPVGNVIVAFPPGSCPGHYPNDLAADSRGNLYVAVWDDHGQVSKYDSLGNLVLYWPTGEEIWGITADAHDAICVSHHTKNVISKWERRVVGVCEEPSGPLSGKIPIGLGQSYPNPFSVGTTIPCVVNGYAVEDGGDGVPGADGAVDIRLVIYDVLGRVVRTLVDGHVTPGMREVVWDGMDDAGHEVKSGIYLVRLEACGETVTQKVVLIR